MRWVTALRIAFLVGAGALASLGFYPAPAGPRGSIDLDPSRCPAWLFAHHGARLLSLVVFPSGIALAIQARKERRWMLGIGAALLLCLAARAVHEVSDDAHPYDSYVELCRQTP